MEKIVVQLTDKNRYSFIGKYRPDLETHNWHYYEVADGGLYHFRKEHIVSIYTCPIKTK